ncbi:MAG: hypothetical protein QF662_03430, partial [Phycisphaerae bacterium]|nr:hypothetical protein [Phycisphaerae bacterium]
IYHLLIVEPPEGRSVSIGARTLSGLGYRGMVFWDTEVFIVPMFQYTRPEAALRLLQYRGRRIEPMRELARGIGCTGARAPWESNQDGSEGTEPWTRHHRTQLHVTAGIGLGIYRYVASTGDIEVLKDGLLELMLEGSRFWASRVTRKGDGYQLLAVCGPDEDHPVVDNNFYTSSFVRWYLRATKELLAEARAAMPEFVESLIKRINLTDAELVEWEQVAENIFIQKPGDDGVIEQFEGYFKLPRGSKDERTPDADQTIKQPDTVMFLRLFPDAYPAEVVKANHLFYEDRTVHGSSLGAGAMALVAGRLGMADHVSKYLKYAARMDLDARHGSGAGVHSACCGVVYSAVAEGIAGVRLLRDAVVVNPVPYPDFSKVALNFRWHGKQVHFEMSDGEASVGALFDDGEVPVIFHGKEHVLRAGETLRLGL